MHRKLLFGAYVLICTIISMNVCDASESFGMFTIFQSKTDDSHSNGEYRHTRDFKYWRLWWSFGKLIESARVPAEPMAKHAPQRLTMG